MYSVQCEYRIEDYNDELSFKVQILSCCHSLLKTCAYRDFNLRNFVGLMLENAPNTVSKYLDVFTPVLIENAPQKN